METTVIFTDAHTYPSGNEQACTALLFELKWPDGFSCPRCLFTEFYEISTRRLPLYECRLCGHQASLLTGTIFEGSKTALTKWFTALSLVSSDGGTSAVRLCNIIRVTYKTAWTMLQKIRYALSTADMNTLLTGAVQVNAAVYNRPLNSSFVASPSEHAFFVGSGVSEDNPVETEYIKMKLISEKHTEHRMIKKQAIHAFSASDISPATTDISFVTKRYSASRFVPLLQLAGQACRWIQRTFNGLGRKHLQTYLDEFCFRWNASRSSSSALSILFQHGMRTRRFTYSQITALSS